MAYLKSQNITADTLVKTGAGVLKSITFSCNDAGRRRA